jgi:hypothetical protein
VLTALALGGITLVLLLRRQAREAVALVLLVAGWLCLFWLIAGQNFTGLPLFFSRSWEVTRLYSATMFVDEARSVFWWGIITLAATAIAIFVAVRRSSSGSKSTRFVAAALAAAFVFLAWKKGFVRADGHVQGFFLSALGLGLAIRPAWTGLLLTTVALFGFALSSPAVFFHTGGFFSQRLQANLRAAISPGAVYAEFAKHTATAEEAAKLPQIRARTGDKPVDVFSDDAATALLNGLNYKPRPVFQSYLAYSPALAELNARFYTGPNAPEFVLARMRMVDNRFLPTDDARVLPILVQSYRPLLEEKGWWLLQRQDTPRHISFRPIKTRHPRLGKRIAVPRSSNALLTATIEVKPTLLGRLRTFLYKAPEVTVTVKDSVGTIRRLRLLTDAAAGGFLINPLLRDRNDFATFFQGKEAPRLRELIVESSAIAPRFYKPNFRITFAEAPWSNDGIRTEASYRAPEP